MRAVKEPSSKPPYHIPLFIAVSWGMYLLIFPYDELVKGPLILWLLLLSAVIGLIGGVLGQIQHSTWGKYSLLVLTLFVGLLYLAYWGKTVLNLGQDAGFSNMLLSILRIKIGLIREFMSSGRIFGGIAFIFWELMPFLQLVLILIWIAVDRSGKTPGRAT